MDNNKNKFSFPPKKQVAAYLDAETIERLDIVIATLKTLPGSSAVTKSAFFNKAISKFLHECDQFFQDEYGVDLDTLIQEEKAAQDIADEDRPTPSEITML